MPRTLGQVPEIQKVEFDASATSSGPYFTPGSIVQLGESSALWLVYDVTVSSTTHKGTAVLHRLRDTTAEQRAVVTAWHPFEHRWLPITDFGPGHNERDPGEE